MSPLDLELLLRRPSRPAWAILVMLGMAAGLHLVGSTQLDSQYQLTRQQLDQLRLAAAPEPAPQLSPPPLLEQRYQAFQRLLGEPQDLNHRVAGTFALAEQQGITLAQGEYKMSADSGAHLLSYQLTLPLRASYPQLRRLVDTLLQAHPNLALADISFKRESISAATPEANLRLVLFLKAEAP